MIKAKPLYFALLFLFSDCRQPSTIDLHAYMLPENDLLQGKIYCYVDSTGASSQFDYVRETFLGSDTFFETIEYDSSFAELGEEKDQLDRDGITPVNMEIFQGGMGIPSQIRSGLIPWILPLQSAATRVLVRFAVKSGGGLVIASMDGNFDRVTDSSLLGRYQAQDCIQENVVLRVDKNDPLKPFHSETREVYCLNKGIGRIGITSSDGRKQFLKKIISKNEFDSLRKLH